MALTEHPFRKNIETCIPPNQMNTKCGMAQMERPESPFWQFCGSGNCAVVTVTSARWKDGRFDVVFLASCAEPLFQRSVPVMEQGIRLSET